MGSTDDKMYEFGEIGVGEMSGSVGVDLIMREIQGFQPRQIGLAEIEAAITADMIVIFIVKALPK